MDEVKHGLYQHYKGGLYEVIGVAMHSETLEELVVYYSRSGHSHEIKLWVRPKENFLETVIINEGDEEKEVPRFKYIESF